MRNKALSSLMIVGVYMASVIGCSAQSAWDIRDFGAVGDSVTLNTQAIQAAINACYDAGGGEVVVPQGAFVSGTLILKDHVKIRLLKGAILQSSINPNDFKSIDPFIDATGQYRGQCLVGAIHAQNIGILGEGTIDGRGKMFTPKKIKETLKSLGVELKVPPLPKVDTSKQHYVNKHIRPSYRPFLIRLVGCSDIEITGVKLRQPAAWTLHLYQCQRFRVQGVSIYSHANSNNDGIDIDSSVDGIITGCNIDSGDDAICFKTTSPKPTARITVDQCRLKSHWGAIKFGTESMGDFRDITIRNCAIHDTRGGGIKILSVDGADIRNIRLDSISMQQVDMPVFIRLGERRLVYRDADRQAVGSIDSLYLSHIRAIARDLDKSRVNPPSGIFITGTPNHHITHLSLKNFHLTLPGGGSTADRRIQVPEHETMYPEFTKFDGPLPAYGLFARHIDQLEMEQVQFELQGPDAREKVIIQ